MRVKPQICLIDEDSQVHEGWGNALKHEAVLHSYPCINAFLSEAQGNPELVPSFSCIIVGRFFKKISVDLCESSHIPKVRELGGHPIFLNWQGYLTKDEIEKKFDGRLFSRYGVRWQTLRSRIQKFKSKTASEEKAQQSKAAVEAPKKEDVNKKSPQDLFESKPKRCQDLLLFMAKNAAGRPKEKLEYYARQNPTKGIELLEALYNRLQIGKENPPNCPSQYINTSPVVAKGVLQKTLFGT